GRELGVDYLVGGSVSTDGDRVRVSLELLDGRNGTVVHSEVVERPFAESRNLVEDVVEQSATILRGEIGSHVRVTRVQALTTSEQAWRFLLEGRHVQEAAVSLLLQREYRAAEREHIRADSLLARAAELDTRWAEPIVQRARVLERRAYSVRFSTPYDSVGYRSLLEAALDMAALAAERDSLYADGWALRGAVLQHLAQIHTDPGRIDRLLQESERALRRA